LGELGRIYCTFYGNVEILERAKAELRITNPDASFCSILPSPHDEIEFSSILYYGFEQGVLNF